MLHYSGQPSASADYKITSTKVPLTSSAVKNRLPSSSRQMPSLDAAFISLSPYQAFEWPLESHGSSGAPCGQTAFQLSADRSKWTECLTWFISAITTSKRSSHGRTGDAPPRATRQNATICKKDLDFFFFFHDYSSPIHSASGGIGWIIASY